MDTSENPEALTPAEPTHEQIEEWRTKAEKADENLDRLMRMAADFENFKKRAAREKQDAVKYANESLIEKLIPVLDSFDMALAAAQNGSPDAAQSLQTGIAMIHQQLRNSLAEAGVEEVDASGKMFDPNIHEAVAQKDAPGAPEGRVVEQLRRGYKLRERLLRPATVVVARHPSEKSQ